MTDYAILCITIITLFVSVKRLGKLLRTGNPELLLKHKEEELRKTKESLNEPNAKSSFLFAWIIVFTFTTFLIVTSTYILTNILNFA